MAVESVVGKVECSVASMDASPAVEMAASWVDVRAVRKDA